MGQETSLKQHTLGYLIHLFTNIVQVVIATIILGYLLGLAQFKLGMIDSLRSIDAKPYWLSFTATCLFFFFKYLDQHQKELIDQNDWQKTIKAAKLIEEKQRQKEAKEKQIQQEEERRYWQRIAKIQAPQKRANKKTKAKFEKLGFFANGDHNLEEKLAFVRVYGFQRFMFSPTKPNPKNLAERLEKQATEANLARLTSKLKPIYSIVPLAEYWFEKDANNWLHVIAEQGIALPYGISFETMAERCELNNRDRRVYIDLRESIYSLFDKKILVTSSNLDEDAATRLFIEDLLNTPKIRRIRKKLEAEGVTFFVDVQKSRSKLGIMGRIPILKFKNSNKSSAVL